MKKYRMMRSSNDSVHNLGNKRGVNKAALDNEIIALKVTKHSKSATILSCQALSSYGEHAH